jgi:hypothetical protein
MEVEGTFNGHFPDELIKCIANFLPHYYACRTLSVSKILYNTYVKDNEYYTEQRSKYEAVRVAKECVMDEIKKINYNVVHREHEDISRRKYAGKTVYSGAYDAGVIGIYSRKHSITIYSYVNKLTNCIVVNAMHKSASISSRYDPGYVYLAAKISYSKLIK